MKKIEPVLAAFSDLAWGPPLLVLLIGGGVFFLIYSRFLPFRYLGMAIDVLRGKQDGPSEGQIKPYEALSTAIAATVGMGNISGVAVAIAMGGPGAIFWMWVAAVIGMATEFFTAALAVMYRGKDAQGGTLGGPMYVIEVGLGKKWRPLAVFFSLAGMVGALPLFQANQLTQSLHALFLNRLGFAENDFSHAITGVLMAAGVGAVILGGISRIGSVAGKLVPVMVGVYGLAVLAILCFHLPDIPAAFQMIFSDAFTGDAVMGGSVGSLIVMGIRRAAFSNEAGIGTTAIAHGAARTNEPIREGLIAMLGPAIDTLVVCTCTALAIIVTGAFRQQHLSGIALTASAFEGTLGTMGWISLGFSVAVFALTTMFSMSFYGVTCCVYLFGPKSRRIYLGFYLGSILFGAVASMQAVINLIDGMYALMAFPTMISALLLAPKVMERARVYFGQKN